MIPYDCVEDVTSSNIKRVGRVYVESTQIDWLVVEFKNGDIYRYKEMASHYQDLVNAASIGRYFSQEIRHQSYEKLSMGEWPDEDS